MGAIIKTIPIHSKRVDGLMKYCANTEKTSVSKSLKANPDLNVSAAMNYAANPLKTICNIDENHKEILISGVKCTPETAAYEFAMAKQRYRELTGNMENYEPFEYTDRKTGKTKMVKREPLSAIHMIQSFNETNLDPHVVHQMGVELLEKLGLQGVVDTHMNKKHLHNHIIINTYMPNGTKWNCNLEERLRIRQISDDLQKEYGLDILFDSPEEQLKQSRGKKRSYKEWMDTQIGISWKAQMKEDIGTILGVSKTRNDYLSMMEAYGYKVLEDKGKTVVFELEENGKKIEDNTLGKEYTIGELFPDGEHKPMQKEYHVIPINKRTISIARYNPDGTQRGMLEMMFRKLIALIQQLMSLFQEDAIIYTTASPQAKIERLQEAIKVVKKYNLNTKADFDKMVDDTGAKLSHMKAEMRKLDIEKELYDTVLSAINEIETLRMVQTHLCDLSLQDFTPDEIRKAKSKIAAITPSDKSAIATAFYNHPEFKLTCKYNELIPSEVNEILNYLRDPSGTKPDMVVSADEYDSQNAIKLAQRIINKKGENLRERYGKTSASKKDIEQITAMFEKLGIQKTLPPVLSKADIMEIRSCYAPNPFSSPVVNQQQKEALELIVNKRQLKLSRPIECITEKEASMLAAYLKNPEKYREPNILKPYEAPRENDLLNAEKIMQSKNIHFTVPLNMMSKQDFEKAYTYILYSGEEPEIFKGTGKVSNQEKDDLFAARIEEYKPERMLYLTQYRDALNILRSCGYNVDEKTDFTEIKKEVQEWLDKYEEAAEQKEEMAAVYHDLMKTRSTVVKAENPEYVFGKNNEEQLQMEVNELDERATEDKEMAAVEKEDTKKKKTKDKGR